MAPISFFRRFSVAKVGFASCVSAFAGIYLGMAIHIAFFALFALGAFGPGLLRELGWLHDLDDGQLAAVRRAGYLAYLIGGIFLTLVIIVHQWGQLSLGDDLIPAFLVLCLLLVVFVLGYGLSFWDARRATAFVLFGLGLFWAVFVVLSHGGEPVTMLAEGGAVVVPFFLGAFFCRRWPKLTGLLILAVAVASLFFFHLTRPGSAQQVYSKLPVVILIPLPLAVLGLALLFSIRRTGDEDSTEKEHSE